MDVVEVSPPFDHAEVTAMAAHRAVLEAISALAVKKRDGRGVRLPDAAAGGRRPPPRATDVTAAAPALRPAPPLDAGKQRIAAAVAAHRDEILAALPRHPRRPRAGLPGGATRRPWVAEVARAATATPWRHPAGRLATAVRGHAGRGPRPDGPRIGILAEYDALPGLGHGCGHNTMAASGVGAAIALADRRDPGCAARSSSLARPPRSAGRASSSCSTTACSRGLTPRCSSTRATATTSSRALLASVDVEVTFTGLQAHAASDPGSGRNALDALVLLFSSIGLWRQQLRPEARVHGIVIEGGTAANIIPAGRSAASWCAARTWRTSRSCRQRFRETGHRRPALAAGLRGARPSSAAAQPVDQAQRAPSRRAFRANMQARRVASTGARTRSARQHGHGQRQPGRCRRSTPTLAICDDGMPGHSTLFRDAAATPRADETTLLAATLMAQTAYDLLTEPELVDAAWRGVPLAT